MQIGGLQKFSLLDYPGHLSSIVFIRGCNFRCQYCYNPMLVCQGHIKQGSDVDDQTAYSDKPISEEEFLKFLNDRKGKLDSVVVTGGEPTIHNDLPDFIKKIKDIGYKVKLDTNGTNSQMVKNLVETSLIDYIAMDIKASPEKYDLVTGVQPDLSEIRKSIRVIRESELPHEFRTTVVPELITLEDIPKMGELIRGTAKWFLQKFKPDADLINKSYQKITPYTDKEMEKMKELALEYVKECEIR